MNDQWMNQAYPNGSSVTAPSVTLGGYTARTFGWMFAGLLTTFLVAFSGYLTGWIALVTYIPGWIYLLLIAEVATVVFLSARVTKMGIGTARALFFLYSALNGIVFSLGMVMHLDFSRIRPLMMGGLIFLAVFWLLGMFINLSQFEMIACTLGIFLFLGYTAYDTSKIKQFYAVYSQDEQMLKKASIIAALELYLDFINLFVYLLRVLGKRK